jgi:hypothetical protein
MNRSVQSNQQLVADPVYRKLHRAVLAACLLLAPLSLAGWFTLCPQYGDPTCPSSVHPDAVFAAFRAANPVLLQIFFYLNLIIPYIYPISYVVLGMVSMKRSPWLSTLGIAFGWVGSIAWGFIAQAIFTGYTAIQLGQDVSFAVLYKAVFANPLVLAVATGWVLGHLGGYVLLGIAHLRARVIPRWAAWLIIMSGPLMGPIAYGFNIGILQVLGYVLVFIGSVPAAYAVLKARGVQASGPVGEKGALAEGVTGDALS